MFILDARIQLAPQAKPVPTFQSIWRIPGHIIQKLWARPRLDQRLLKEAVMPIFQATANVNEPRREMQVFATEPAR
jgi:hypothetical protein